jgi:hypothetical protein
MSHTLERRKLLRGAGVVGISAVGAAAVPSAASAHESTHGLLGAWRIRHTDDPPSTDSGIAIVTFAAGGVFATEELPSGSLGLGTWAADGDKFRVLFFESQPGPDGQPGVVVTIRVRGRLRGDHISGTYRLTVRSASDDTVVGRGTGTFRGERLQA